jgi:hypothetical protein
VRQRTLSALDTYLSERTPSQVEALTGIHRTTVGRRGPDLAAWSAADLVAMACDCDETRRSIAAALCPEFATAGLLAEVEAREAVGEMGAQISAVMERLDDGRLDHAERTATAAEFRRLAEHMTRRAAAMEV